VSGPGPDPLLRRLERRALWFCALAALSAVALQRGRLEFALGVLGGGLLIGLSYWAIRSSIDGLLALAGGRTGDPPSGEHVPVAPSATRAGQRQAARHLLRFVGRYLVLGVLAYLMLTRLRLHPVGLIVGVSAIVVAATVEALQTTWRGVGRTPGPR
jgi:hypothetical protein